MDKKIKLMIFDNDMTLVDSSHAIMEGFNQVADKVNRPRVSHAKVMQCIAMPLPQFCEGLLGEYHPEWVKMYLDNSAQNERDFLRPFDDTVLALKKLKKAGVFIAMATNRENPEPVLTRTGLIKYMDDMIGASAPHGNFAYKPSPDMLFKLIKNFNKKFNIKAEDAVYIGDSDIDAQTAFNAGMRFIGVPRGNFSAEELLNFGAWRTIKKSLLELADFLD